MRATLPAILALSLALTGLARADLTVRVPRATIVEKIKATFKGVRVFVGEDRSGPLGETLPGSSIQFGPALGNKVIPFSVPKQERDLGFFGKVSYSPNGIYVKDYAVRATAKEFEVTLYFASTDVALKGTHSFLGDSGAPDIELNGAHVLVRMRPVVGEGSKIYFAKPEVSFWADVQTQGLSWNILGRRFDLLDSVTGYRDKIKEAIEGQLANALAGPNARSLLAQKVQEFITQQAGKVGAKIVRLAMEGTDLLITLKKN